MDHSSHQLSVAMVIARKAPSNIQPLGISMQLVCLCAEDLDFAVPLVSAEFADSTAIQLDVDQSNQRKISSAFSTKCAVVTLSPVPCVLASVRWEQVRSPSSCLRFTHPLDDPASGHLFLFSAVTFFYLSKNRLQRLEPQRKLPINQLTHFPCGKKKSLVICVGSLCFLSSILS